MERKKKNNNYSQQHSILAPTTSNKWSRKKCVKEPAAINNKHCFLVSGTCSIKPNKIILLHLAAVWLTKLITQHFYYLELGSKLLGAVQLLQINAAKCMYETHIIHEKNAIA